jgi:hypothetical protein
LKEEELRELKGLEKEAKGALSVSLCLSLSLFRTGPGTAPWSLGLAVVLKFE